MHGVSPEEAYARSLVAINEMIDHLLDCGVENVSGWATSDRTGMRSEGELILIMKVLRTFLHKVSATYPQRGIRFRTIGARDRLEAFDSGFCREVEAAERATRHGRATVFLLVDYSSREELVRAYRRLQEAGEPLDGLTPERLAGFLDTHGAPDPDLVIRPGGCPRLSGLYAFQTANAEVHVLDDVMMPDFTTDILDDLLARYAARRSALA